jgi:hypothetical protein
MGEILSAEGIHSVLRFADTDSVAIWVMPAVALAELITDQDGVRRPLDGDGGTSPDRLSVRIRARHPPFSATNVTRPAIVEIDV